MFSVCDAVPFNVCTFNHILKAPPHKYEVFLFILLALQPIVGLYFAAL